MTKCSIIIATHGDPSWEALAWSRAYPSTTGQDAHEVLIRHFSGGTVTEARNALAAEAEGDVLIHLDADDELRPGYLDAMEPWLAQSRMILSFDQTEMRADAAAIPDLLPPSLLVPSVEYVNVDGTRQPPRIPQQGFWPKLNECVIGTAIPRWLFEKVGGFRELPSLEDYDLFLRCFDAGASLQYVPGAVYVAHMREGSRNSDQSTYHQIWAEHLERVAS